MDVLEMSRRRHGELVVVSLAGEMDVDNVSEVRKCLNEAAAAPEPRLVVDLSALTFIDTTGLGVLVRMLASLRDRNGTMALVAPDGQVLRRLRRTNLAPLFPIYDTLSQALA
ncbi:STAS domain-containing protein [Nonomuraea gerenzanensis]|uniref:Anti-sigma factor antagonist n=1 Tax=Nonomuraea gerenzanensis TaxID=93944 RepID=A0A1M4E7I4_9ACTN|nr:STAS domain-containing protein [Nonomuraea gerenzanensis]UBU16960.1 STAS domain-containing protein [Nonomuraea gerenzanensis]SBO94683.1 Anti-sigma F factor antagonist (spoIIAA-2); Anti-sigma B factor antagonist RsbV [Nonomuraea gerenzanensis]